MATSSSSQGWVIKAAYCFIRGWTVKTSYNSFTATHNSQRRFPNQTLHENGGGYKGSAQKSLSEYLQSCEKRQHDSLQHLNMLIQHTHCRTAIFHLSSQNNHLKMVTALHSNTTRPPFSFFPRGCHFTGLLPLPRAGKAIQSDLVQNVYCPMVSWEVCK